MPQFTRDWAFFRHGLVASAMVFDMRDVLFFSDNLMHILIVVALVCAEMLFDLFRVRALNHNGNDQVIC